MAQITHLAQHSIQPVSVPEITEKESAFIPLLPHVVGLPLRCLMQWAYAAPELLYGSEHKVAPAAVV